jgi:DNA-directed RNA polymerase subunit beta'
MAELTPQAAFDSLKSNVVDSIQSYFPFKGRQRTIQIDKIWVDDSLTPDDIHSQQDAREHEKTWGVPIKAQMSLIDNATGKVLDKSSKTLAVLPKLTNRYGFIVNGNEYQVDHLFRLKSGIYSRVQENGDLEAEFNLAKSPARGGLSIYFDATGDKTFSLKYKDSHIPLYPILKTMGIPDEQLEREWGKAIFDANVPKNPKKFQRALVDFHKKLGGDVPAPQTMEEYGKFIHDFFDKTEVRADTTKITLGQPFTKVDGDLMRAASKKVLEIHRNNALPDDRDSLMFKEIVSVEDFLPERIRTNIRAVRDRLRQTVDHKGSITEIVNAKLFHEPIQDFFSKGGAIAERGDQTNPLMMIGGHRKTTLMSEKFGGIKSDFSLTEDMRAINPSSMGFLDPIHTPESERTGITLHLASGARKNGKELEAPVFNMKTKELEFMKVPEYHQAMMVLPDQVRWKGNTPVPISENVKMKMPGGLIEVRPYKDAHFVMPSAKSMFDEVTNLIPFLPCDQGNRVAMANKQMEQTISLKHREAPMVMSKTHQEGGTFEKYLGEFATHHAPVNGKVTSVTSREVVVADSNGKKHKVQLYDHFSLNDPKGMMHSVPVVKVGDHVKEDQLIADTNFTKDGHLAIGTNLRVGYMPYKGYNFDDGVVISESAAKKFTSEHLYRPSMEIDPDSDHIDKAKWYAHAIGKSHSFTPEMLDAVGDDGVIKVGTRVQKGQVLVAAVSKVADSKRAQALANLGKRAFQPYKDKSIYWDQDHAGEVIRVVKDPSGKGIKVFVKTEEPMEVGDKLAGRHGNKGIVTQIIPDHEMPFTKDEKGERRHLEVLLNPLGVPSRINLGQTLETAAAKIAEKTGKPYIVDNFAGSGKNYRVDLMNELKAHGISDEESVYDPKNPNKVLGSVLVGPQYLLKLKHQVEKKLSARGAGVDLNKKPLYYDQDKQPGKGGGSSGQGFGALDMYALLGHNARHNIREMTTYKSDEQDMQTFWNLVQEGKEPPPPQVPFAYQKFEAMMKGAGINMVKDGTKIRLAPMTDKETMLLAGGPKGEIKKPHLTLYSKDLKPESGGLYDPHVTGGMDGSKWSFIRLAEPLPNPMFVGGNNRPGPVPTLLGIGVGAVDKIIRGELSLDGKTGGKAIVEALKKVNIDHEMGILKPQLATLTGQELDRANRKLKYLQALKETGLKPHEAYTTSLIPVLPPKFRPASPTHGGDISYAPVNGLYKNIGIINNQLTAVDPASFTDQHKNPLRAQLWDAYKALQSVGKYKPVYDTDSRGQRTLKGLLDTIGSGDDEQPKQGYFQSRLVKHRQDLSIRSTIVPEPKLHLDEVGIPRSAAMEMYRPFVVARMHHWGYAPLEAQKHAKEMSDVAKKALEEVVKDRPLLLKRDPVLHKFNIMAFRPVLHDGKAIQIHPLVTGGFNADFDGDTMAGTVPVSREAVEEAKKMFPSKNLFSATSYGAMYTPTQESLLGLYLLTKWGKKTDKSFANPLEADKAATKGLIAHTDVIKIGGKETTLGRQQVADRLPADFVHREKILRDSSFVISKKTLGSQIVESLARSHPRDLPNYLDRLKDLGNAHAYESGFSFGLKDLAPIPEREGVMAQAHTDVAHARKTISDPKALHQKIVDVYQAATENLVTRAEERHKEDGNRFAAMVLSGAKGKRDQYRQMVVAPVLMMDANSKVITTPVTKSYSEGLDIGEYWITQHGARKGTVQRAQGTSEPGVMTKDIINATMDSLIQSKDCGTKHGILMPLEHKDIFDRFTAMPYKLKDGTVIKAGSVVTPDLVSRLKNSSKENKILVRSPLKCQHGQGMCATCFGLNENGALHDVGTNIGVLAGQAMGEPITQMAMDSFHTGGVATGRGAESVDRFRFLRNLLAMPKQMKNETALATHDGAVTNIKKDATGIHNEVHIDGKIHLVPVKQELKVKIGDQVSAGQPLGKGVVNPHQFLEITRDIDKLQHHLTTELDSVYQKEGVRRRNLELVVRSLTNLAKIKDPGHSHWDHGDIVPRSVLEEHNRNLPAGQKHVEHSPLLTGIRQVTLTGSKDWMSRLNYQYLHQTIQQGAQQGWSSDLHGTHPIPAIAQGKEFGKPPPGKPSHNY